MLNSRDAENFKKASLLQKERIGLAFESLRGVSGQQTDLSKHVASENYVANRASYANYFRGVQFGDVAKLVKEVRGSSGKAFSVSDLLTKSAESNAFGLAVPLGGSVGDDDEHSVAAIVPILKKMVKKKTAETLRGINHIEVVSPVSTGGRDDKIQAANTVANWIVDRYGLVGQVNKLVQHALVQEEVFCNVVWDPTRCGVRAESISAEGEKASMPYLPGDLHIEIIDGCDIGWEPRKEYEESRWWVRKCYDTFQTICDRFRLDDSGKEQIFGKRIKYDPTDIVAYHVYIESAKVSYVDKVPQFVPMRQEVIIEGIVVASEELDWLANKPPFTYFYYAYVPGSDRNHGLVRDLMLPQTLYNTIQGRTIEYMEWGVARAGMTLTPNEMIAASPGETLEDLSSDMETLQNPGKLGLVPPGYDISRISGEALPSSLLDFQDRVASLMDQLACVETPPTSIDSGKGLDAWAKTNADQDRQFIDLVRSGFAEMVRRCLAIWKVKTEAYRVTMRVQHPILGTKYEAISGLDLMDELEVRLQPTAVDETSFDHIKEFALAALSQGMITPQMAAQIMTQRTAEPLLAVVRQTQGYAQSIIAKLETYSRNLNQEQDPGKRGILLAELNMDEALDPPAYSKDVGELLAILQAYQQEPEYRRLNPDVQKKFGEVMLAYKEADVRQRVESEEQQSLMAEKAGRANASIPGQSISGNVGGNPEQVA